MGGLRILAQNLRRMLYVHAYVRVFPVVAAQGDKETHSDPQ